MTAAGVVGPVDPIAGSPLASPQIHARINRHITASLRRRPEPPLATGIPCDRACGVWPATLSQGGWNPRTLAAAAFIGMYILWQVVVPASALLASRPARFGWQMYSARPDLPKAWATDASGLETPIDMEQVFAQVRAEIDFSAALRSAVCASSGAVAVRIQDPQRAGPELLTCR